jgi:hypothetical protein
MREPVNCFPPKIAEDKPASKLSKSDLRDCRILYEGKRCLTCKYRFACFTLEKCNGLCFECPKSVECEKPL